MRGILALAAAALACSVASPETEVKEALARLAGAELPAGRATLRLERLRFADVTVAVDGARARVLAMVEADGVVEGGGEVPGAGARLAYVGREDFPVERCAARRWCLADLPALRGVVAALREAPRPAGARVVAWQVRVERDRATAGEDAEEGGRRSRVVRELSRDGGGWRLAAR